MKLIIDIPEETYKKCKWKNNGVVGLERELYELTKEYRFHKGDQT